MQAAVGTAVITPQRCHAVTSSISLTFAQWQKLTHFAAPAFPSESPIRREPLCRAPQGSVSSLWTGVSKYHYPPCCHRVPACQGRLKKCVDRSASLSVHLLKPTSWRRIFYRCLHGFCACNTVYSILKVREGDGGKRTFHLSQKRGGVLPIFAPFWKKSRNIFQRGADGPGRTCF